jgi:hypothetical protein
VSRCFSCRERLTGVSHTYAVHLRHFHGFSSPLHLPHIESKVHHNAELQLKLSAVEVIEFGADSLQVLVWVCDGWGRRVRAVSGQSC